VLVDVCVATLMLLIVIGSAAAAFPMRPVAFAYSLMAALLAILALVRVTVPILRQRPFVPTLDMCLPRHAVGLMLIALPLGVAACYVCAQPDDTTNVRVFASWHLHCAYIFVIAMFGHVNFSQLGCWPKTAQAGVIGGALVGLSLTCATPNNIYCDSTDMPTVSVR
jgi:hypothetical protein